MQRVPHNSVKLHFRETILQIICNHTVQHITHKHHTCITPTTIHEHTTHKYKIFMKNTPHTTKVLYQDTTHRLAHPAHTTHLAHRIGHINTIYAHTSHVHHVLTHALHTPHIHHTPCIYHKLTQHRSQVPFKSLWTPRTLTKDHRVVDAVDLSGLSQSPSLIHTLHLGVLYKHAPTLRWKSYRIKVRP